MSEKPDFSPLPKDPNTRFKAYFLVFQKVGIPAETLSQIIGVPATDIARFQVTNFDIQGDKKSHELAAIAAEICTDLMCIVQDSIAVKSWLYNENIGLHGTPIQMMQNVRGLIEVSDYVKHYRYGP